MTATPTPAPARPSLLARLYAFATSPATVTLVHRAITAALAVYVAVHRAGL